MKEGRKEGRKEEGDMDESQVDSTTATLRSAFLVRSSSRASRVCLSEGRTRTLEKRGHVALI